MALFDFINKKKISDMQKEIDNLKRQVDLVEIKKEYAEESRVQSVLNLEAVKNTNYYARVFEVDNAWQYEILHNDIPVVKQDFYPGAAGFVPMTFEQATEFANEIVTRMREAEYGDNE